MSNLEELHKRFQNKDRRALSRLLSLAREVEHAQTIRTKIGGCEWACPLVAMTGGAGVGKSSLIRGLVELLRTRGKTVAVLACDPESPKTGGALMGDRIRMAGSSDAGVFIRSLAAKSGQQAIAANLDLMARLLAIFGFEMVLLETVGAGQGDTAVRELADVLVLLVQPHTGDELQWEKAGLLEVADVVVVNKSDLPGADQVKVQIENQLGYPGSRATPVLDASATHSVGLVELLAAIEVAAKDSAAS